MSIESGNQLVAKVKSYNPNVNAGAIGDALSFASRAHDGQVRASGEAYFTHPLAVAGILSELRLDQASVMTALLHDVVEDTEVSLEEIRVEFGDEIARLVDGVTKLTRIEVQSDNTQAENFRKLVLAMSEDIRVLVVKLADRIHNMRTIEFVPEEKRERIALETLMIFAPLAERVGITPFQHELEDRAFAILNPQARDSILQRMEYLESSAARSITNTCNKLRSILKKEGITASLSGRQKTAYSIWRKMQRHAVEMDALSDITAFRIIVDSEEECYRSLGIIHQRFKVVPGRFKDYISTPKRNRYQSLHTGVIGPLKRKIEIQIRTPLMHEIAEKGVAAHWAYKEKNKPLPSKEITQVKWLKDLLNILETAASPDEFLEHTQMEMYADQVFCFTPKGALINLPQGATAVDFAYAVHSDIGNTCVATKINGKTRQLATPLRNGDQVEIITSKDAHPNPEWENFVLTGKAKASVRRFVRLTQQKEFSRLGKAMVRELFRQQKRKLSKAMSSACLAYFDVNSDAELYAKVGNGHIKAQDLLLYLYPDTRIKKEKKRSKKSSAEVPFNIKGLTPGMAVHIGTCCHPLPGEKIVGIITTGKGLTVHRVDCGNLEKFSSMPELWQEIEWKQAEANVVSVSLVSVLSNERGSLATVATLISQNGGNITNIQLLSRTLDFFTFGLEIEVSHARHMTAILAALRASPFIESVERAKT